jgi:hypothetical protein
MLTPAHSPSAKPTRRRSCSVAARGAVPISSSSARVPPPRTISPPASTLRFQESLHSAAESRPVTAGWRSRRSTRAISTSRSRSSSSGNNPARTSRSASLGLRAQRAHHLEPARALRRARQDRAQLLALRDAARERQADLEVEARAAGEVVVLQGRLGRAPQARVVQHRRQGRDDLLALARGRALAARLQRLLRGRVAEARQRHQARAVDPEVLAALEQVGEVGDALALAALAAGLDQLRARGRVALLELVADPLPRQVAARANNSSPAGSSVSRRP